MHEKLIDSALETANIQREMDALKKEMSKMSSEQNLIDQINDLNAKNELQNDQLQDYQK